MHIIIIFLSNFATIFFNIHLFFKYLHFLQTFTFPYLFIYPLPSTLISLSFILSSFIYLFLFTSSYYKFFILFSILCIVFPHKKVISPSLSLSLKFLVDFYFSCISALSLYFLYFWNCNLGWYDLVLCLSYCYYFLFSLIVKYFAIKL